MDPAYIPIVSAVVAGLTATGASLGTVWLQARAQNQRERTKLAIEVATQDYKERMGLMQKVGGEMPSIVAFMHYHAELQKILDKRELRPEDIEDLSRRNKAIVDAMRKLSDGPTLVQKDGVA